MKTETKTKIFILFMMACIFSAFGCSREQQTLPEDLATSELIDSFTKLYFIEKNADLEHSKQLIQSFQAQVTDSLDFYNLASFRVRLFFQENKMDSAMMVSRQILRYCQSKPETSSHLTMNALNDLGVFYQQIGLRDSAIIYLNRAINASSFVKNREKKIDIYINLADNYMQNSDFIQSADYYRLALQLADSLYLHDKYAAPILMGLAHIYIDLNNFELADNYLLEIEHKLDSLPIGEQLYFCNTRGNYYYNTKEYAASLPWFYKTRELSIKHKQQYYTDLADINLAETYLLLAQFDSAQFYLRKADVVFRTPHAPPAIIFYLDGLYASLYLKTNQLKKAESYLRENYDSTGINQVYINLHEKRLEELYRQQGNFKQAYFYAKKTEAFDNSSRKTTIHNNIQEIKHRYSQDTTLLHKDLIIKDQQQKSQSLQQKLIILFGSIIVMVLGFAFILLFLKRRKEKQEVRQLNTISELRMQNIKNRMSPHFVFNAINALVPNLRKHTQLSHSVDNLITTLRDNLTRSEKTFVQLDDEIRGVKNYLALLESIHYELPTINWQIDNSVDLTSNTLSMSVQIPIENSIKHAFCERTANDKITVSMQQINDCLEIKIIDNGSGFSTSEPQTTNAHSTGNGLKILFRTIEILNRKNAEKITMNIYNTANEPTNCRGTTVSFSIPINYKFEL